MTSSQIWIGAAAVALLLVSALADDVLVLTEENFDKEVGQDRAALVEFYAPWYCRNLSPVIYWFYVAFVCLWSRVGSAV
ncbi:hypothetical protein NL676_021609 [Syzygium grande]|nr:hypothetical protein NL676_021609 [Syzygium grande]